MPLNPNVRILHAIDHEGVTYEIDSEDASAVPIPIPVQRKAAVHLASLPAGANLITFSIEGNPAKYNVSLQGFRDGTLGAVKR